MCPTDIDPTVWITMNIFRCSLIADGVQHNGRLYNQPDLLHSNPLSFAARKWAIWLWTDPAPVDDPALFFSAQLFYHHFERPIFAHSGHSSSAITSRL